MVKQKVNCLRILAGILTLLILMPQIFAADPGHEAVEISAGIFESGNYTFPDSLHIDKFLNVTGLLYVDPLTSRVGIGTTSPSKTLEVVGTAAVGDLNATSLDVRGLCVAEDTLISVVESTSTSGTDSITEQENINQNYEIKKTEIKDVKPGDKVLSLDETTGRIVTNKVNALLDMDYKPIYELTTETGRSINTTGNHPYLTPNGWVKVKELEKGDEIAVPYLSSVGSVMMPELVKNDGIIFDFEYENKASNMNPFVIAKISPEILKMFNKSYVIADNLSDLFSDCDSKSLVPMSEFVDDLFQGRCDNELKSHSKPISLSNSCRVIGFILPDLRSWDALSTDSTTSLTTESFTSLISSGAISDISRTFLVNLSSLTSRNVSENACLAIEDQLTQSTLSILDFNSAGTDNVIVFILDLQHKYLYYVYAQDIFKPFETLQVLENLFPRQGMYNSSVSKPRNCESNFLCFDSGSDIFFDRIVSIKTHEPQHVYDLAIENTHNFIANDIIAHNTYISGNVSLADNLTVGGNALYVDSSSGRVGIGTTEPQTKLEIVSDGATFIMRAPTANQYGNFRIYNDQNSATRALEMGYTGTSYAGFGGLTGEFAYLIPSGGGTYPLALGFNNNALTMVISAGKVGIGTSTPSQLLDVRGEGNFSGTIYVNNATDITTLTGAGDLSNYAVTNDTNTFLAEQNITGRFSVHNTSDTFFYVDNETGRVGIGTTTIPEKLSLDGVLALSESANAPDATAGFGKIYAKTATSGIDSYTKLLLHANGTNASTTFTDETGKTVTANGDAQINIDQSKFGGASALFDGAGDYLSSLDSDDWNIGSGDWTIDGWYRFTASPAGTYLWSQYEADGTDYYYLFYNAATSQLYFTVITDTSTWVAGYRYTWSPSLDTWYHIELARSGLNIYLFIDGTLITWTTIFQAIGSSSIPDVAAPFTLPGLAGAVPFAGYVDEFRFSKGIARHTASFTPSTQAYGVGQVYYKNSAGDEVVLGSSGSGSSVSLWGQNGASLYYNSGNVGIGTTTPSALLDVAGSQALGSALAANLSGVLYVNESNVGIGTTSPAFKLDVYGDINATGVFTNVTSCANGLITAADGSLVCSDSAFGGSMDYTNIAMLNETVLNVTYVRMDEVNNTYARLNDENTFTGLNHFSANVSLADNLTVGGDKLYVDSSSGNVGIGTTNPLAPLEIVRDHDFARIDFDEIGGYGNRKRFSITSGFWSGDQDDLRIQARNDAGVLVSDLVTIQHYTGNVGIGTTEPGDAKLNVSGTVDAWQVTINGTAVGTGSGSMDYTNIAMLNETVLNGTYVRMDEVNNTYARLNDANTFTGLNHFSANVSIADNLTVGGDKLYVDSSSGRVGIGTTSPAFKLDVYGDINATGVFTNVTSCSNGLVTTADGSLVCSGSAFGGGMDYTNIAMLNETTLNVTYVRMDEVNNTYARLDDANTFTAAQTIDNTSAVTTAYLNISDGTSPKLIVDSAGNVGIGTKGPSKNLDIAGALSGSAGSYTNQPTIRLTQTANYAYNIGDIHSSLEFYSLDSSWGAGLQAYIAVATTRDDGITHADTGLYFGTSNGVTKASYTNPQMVIKNNGNVGIGTTSPTHTLNVLGTANVTGDVFLPTQSLASCTGKLITSSNGNITCGTDATGNDVAYDPTNIAFLNETVLNGTYVRMDEVNNTYARLNDENTFAANATFSDSIIVTKAVYGPSFVVDGSGNIIANSFGGAGTGLTGTASGLSIGGDAGSVDSHSITSSIDNRIVRHNGVNLGDSGIQDGSDAVAITIDSSEKVGIGTTIPTHTFSVVGTMNVTRAAGAAGGIEVTSTGDVVIRLG